MSRSHDRNHVQFDVISGRDLEFEEFYGADGEWTATNRLTRSYIGSSSLRNQNQPSRCIVIEYWSEMVVNEQHWAYRSDAVTSLEARRSALVTAAEPLGIFTALDVPERTGTAWSQRKSGNKNETL